MGLANSYIHGIDRSVSASCHVASLFPEPCTVDWSQRPRLRHQSAQNGGNQTVAPAARALARVGSATRCNAVQLVATRCSSIQPGTTRCNPVQLGAAQHTALQHRVARCNKVRPNRHHGRVPRRRRTRQGTRHAPLLVCRTLLQLQRRSHHRPGGLPTGSITESAVATSGAGKRAVPDVFPAGDLAPARHWRGGPHQPSRRVHHVRMPALRRTRRVRRLIRGCRSQHCRLSGA